MYSSAQDRLGRGLVAIKKITKPFGSPVLAQKALREMKLLRYLQHENVCPYRQWNRRSRINQFPDCQPTRCIPISGRELVRGNTNSQNSPLTVLGIS